MTTNNKIKTNERKLKSYGNEWEVFHTIRELEEQVGLFDDNNNSIGEEEEEEEEISKSFDCKIKDDSINNNEQLPHHLSEMYHKTARDVLEILKEWRNDHTNEEGWKSLLNKANLLHEVEESIIALYYLRQWMIEEKSKLHNKNSRPFMVVDVCCGKGVFSMILSYMTENHSEFSNLTKIILLDKDLNIDWSHIEAANSSRRIVNHNNPINENDSTIRPEMEVWPGMNLHDYDSIIVPRLLAYNQPMALIGIHLCKTLGPAFVSLVNTLGNDQVPYLCLAPCCLPRLSMKNGISIANYETPLQRNMRLKAVQQHKASRDRRRSRCFICEGRHHVNDCPQKVHYVNNDNIEDWNERVKKAISMVPCWNCGEVGHRRADCTKERIALIEKPTRRMNVSELIIPRKAKETYKSTTFESYCKLLSGFIEDVNSLKIVDSGLLSLKAKKESNNKNNWNRHRKGLFIVVSR